MWSRLIYLWPPSFFGLSSKDKALLHKEVFQLIYYGEGFTHSDVYDMPTYLRRFYLKELNTTKGEENKEVENAKNSNLNKSKVSRPNITRKM